MTDQERDNLISYVLEAGYTDGDHHKQWYLDQILRLLKNEHEYCTWREETTDGQNWEEGIPP